MNIGDKTWIVQLQNRARYDTCECCAGKKKLTIMFGDGVQGQVDCGGCSSSSIYEPPTGVVTRYEYDIVVSEATVVGMRMEQGKLRLETNPYHTGPLLETREDAEAHGKKLLEEHRAEVERRIQLKYDDKKSWSWNASYHRKEIKRLERDLAHHREKLGWAEEKSRHAKKTPKGR